MKILSIVCLLALIISCSKEGEITKTPSTTIEINGKEYRFIQIVPADGAHGVWILVPKDANVRVPQATSVRVSCGKNCTRELTALVVEPF